MNWGKVIANFWLGFLTTIAALYAGGALPDFETVKISVFGAVIAGGLSAVAEYLRETSEDGSLKKALSVNVGII